MPLFEFRWIFDDFDKCELLTGRFSEEIGLGTVDVFRPIGTDGDESVSDDEIFVSVRVGDSMRT